MELSLDEAKNEARFAHGRLAQQHQLELTDLALGASVGARLRGGRGRGGCVSIACHRNWLVSVAKRGAVEKCFVIYVYRKNIQTLKVKQEERESRKK